MSDKRATLYVNVDQEVREKSIRLAHYYGFRTLTNVVSTAINMLYEAHSKRTQPQQKVRDEDA